MAVPYSNTNNFAENVSIAANIFTEYGDYLNAVIRSKVKEDAQANDLYQDFFLSLVSKPLPADVQNIKSYLYKAVTRDIYDESRKKSRDAALMKRYGDILTHSSKRREKAVSNEEPLYQILELIERELPSSQQKAINLRYKNGYDIKEIAEKMNVNSKSVRTYIYTGLKKVRLFLRADQRRSQ
ncbi:RNA polymerase sigma factor [Planctomycetota bacterium]